MSKKAKKSHRIGGVKIWVIFLIIALSVGATFGVYKLTDSFTKGVTDLIYNEDNLVRTIEEYEGKSGNVGNGLQFTAYDNMSVLVKGKINDESERYEWVLGTVIIEENGKYTLTGMDGASTTTAYIKGAYTDTEGNERTFIGDISSSMTVELVKGTSVELSIIVFPGVDINTIVKPTLVLGDKAGRF